MIRLALLDDHLAAVSGLRRVLVHARDVEVLAAAADEVTLARELRGRRPDILIVGYEPGRGDALSLCRRVKARPGAPRVLLYTAYAGAALTIAARIAQADGLLDTSESAGTVIDVIRRMAGGEVVMPKVSRRAFEAAVARLDDRDLPVFAMLLDGAPLAEIADGLLTDERRAARRVRELVGRICSGAEPGEAQGSMSPRRIA
jgi:DNA-binding NarL/FixJ family response regulator